MLPSFAPVVLFLKWQSDYLAQNNVLQRENPAGGKFTFVISKVLAARMRKLITARARKNKRTARMLANARKDHSTTLIEADPCVSRVLSDLTPERYHLLWNGIDYITMAIRCSAIIIVPALVNHTRDSGGNQA